MCIDIDLRFVLVAYIAHVDKGMNAIHHKHVSLNHRDMRITE